MSDQNLRQSLARRSGQEHCNRVSKNEKMQKLAFRANILSVFVSAENILMFKLFFFNYLALPLYFQALGNKSFLHFPKSPEHPKNPIFDFTGWLYLFSTGNLLLIHLYSSLPNYVLNIGCSVKQCWRLLQAIQSATRLFAIFSIGNDDFMLLDHPINNVHSLPRSCYVCREHGNSDK